MSIRTRQEQFHCGKCKAMLILIAYDMVCPNCNWQFKELSKDEQTPSNDSQRTHAVLATVLLAPREQHRISAHH